MGQLRLRLTTDGSSLKRFVAHVLLVKGGAHGEPHLFEGAYVLGSRNGALALRVDGLGRDQQEEDNDFRLVPTADIGI